MELSIDTASDLASIALSRVGEVTRERSWMCRRNHTVELLPAIDALLEEAGAAKIDLKAVFISTGPGTYTGLRVGVSIAKGIARALGLPMAGVGRLELDAYPHRGFDGSIVAVHRAGRGDLAWAVYRGDPWREVTQPKLTAPEELAGAIGISSLVVGEVDDALRGALGKRARFTDQPPAGRATALAHLGYKRLAAGQSDEPALLRPVYLRPPAIRPQATS